VPLLALALPAGAVAAGLEAGVASVDIAPATGIGMYGFANRKGGATGVLDPLMTRVLVLEAGEKRLALVAMDLGEPLAGTWIEALRAKAATTSGTSYVLVAATHTHSGPRIPDEYPPRQPPDWESLVLDEPGRLRDAPEDLAG
jgi:neutral ceramidase